MNVSYKKLWSVMKDRKINKTQLSKEAGIAVKTVLKLERNKNIRVDALVKICEVLNCKADDIIEIISDEKKQDF